MGWVAPDMIEAGRVVIIERGDIAFTRIVGQVLPSNTLNNTNSINI